jgi:hypothetical protein
MGKTELELITPLITCRLFKRDVVETINFIICILRWTNIDKGGKS